MRLDSQNLAIWYLRERRGETLSHYLHYPVTLGCLPCTWKSNAPFLRLHIAATAFLAEEGWMWLPSKSINVTSLINLEGHHCTSIKKGWVQFSLSPDCLWGTQVAVGVGKSLFWSLPPHIFYPKALCKSLRSNENYTQDSELQWCRRIVAKPQNTPK